MLIITEGCNLRCSYCYEQGKDYDIRNRMSWPVARKAVDLFFGQVPEKMERTSITFFGGEPALEFDLIGKVIAYSYRHRTVGGYIGRNYNYVINTNGTILTEEMFSLFSRLGKRLNVRISVDGFREKHDVTRRTADGRGSWHLLEENLPRYRELKEKHGVRVNLVSTLNKSTCRDIFYNQVHLYELTGMQIGFLFIHEDKWEAGDFEVIKEQAVLLHEYGLKHRVHFPLCSTRTPKSGSGNNGGFQNICSGGISSFTVNHAGEIFSCHRGYYYGFGDTFRLGHVDAGFSGAKRAMMYEMNNMNMLPLKCRECRPGIRHKCHLCMPSNRKSYGDCFTVPNNYCLLMKELYYLILERERKIQQITRSG